MATYFHGSSEIQADGLQTLYLMNPNFVGGYSDTNHQQQQQQQPSNMLFLNSAAGNALNAATLSHAPPPQNHHFVGIPLSALGSANSEDPSRPSSMPEIPALHGVIPRFHYNLWGGGAAMDQTAAGNHHQHIPTAVAGTTSSGGGGGDDVVTQLGFRRPAVVSPTAQQGLSLSLSSQQPAAAFRSLAGEVRDISGQAPVNMISPTSGGEDVQGSGGSSSTVSNGIPGMQSLILGSKYLKAAQQLLDEVVNVEKAIKSDTTVEGTNKEMTKMMNKESMAENGDNGNSNGSEASSKLGAELTTAQRQELQMKKAKLLSMLDEVEQRYKQYHHQTQIVASSFEQAAGIGSAKSYTAVALQTISKQFRCLKDAITAQIKSVSKSLGEEESLGLGKGGEGSSRLKFVDHHLRQQRALQQLGMIHQHNAWRPQRGLPERAVSVLRAWLFEHFLHPYPKDSDKHMLAKQTGLTRSQVSNWFINARVRLWKPMVEEMYMEEIKEHQDHNGSEKNTNNKTEPNKDSSPGPKTTTTAPPQENTNTTTFHQMNPTNNNNLKSKQDVRLMMMNQTAAASSPRHEFPNSTASTSPQLGGGFTLIGSSEMEGIVQRLSPKKARSSVATTSDYMQNSPSSILSMDMDMKPAGDIKFGIGNERQSYSSLIAEGGGGFGGYPIGEIGRFPAGGNNSSTVSLTLGLPHCDNLSLSGSAQQNYLSNHQAIQLGSRLEMSSVDAHFGGINNHPPAPPPSHSNAGFESLNNIQNGKRFAAQLLPDFVA